MPFFIIMKITRLQTYLERASSTTHYDRSQPFFFYEVPQLARELHALIVFALKFPARPHLMKTTHAYIMLHRHTLVLFFNSTFNLHATGIAHVVQSRFEINLLCA